ncbi:MAG: GMP/IMP nucleotidase [Pseudomonadota bacterium]
MLDWKDIDTVLLDMDGTLLDLNFDNYFWQHLLPQRYAQKHGVDEQAARLELQRRFRAQEGTLAWYCLDYWREDLGLDIVTLKHEIKHLIGVLPHALEFLKALRHSGKRVLLVTNAHHDSLTLKMEQTSLRGYFDKIICSHDFKAPKESRDFWERMHAQERFDPARAVMFDDSLPVLRAARGFGIAHLIAMRKPDTRMPEREITEFSSISGFCEIMGPAFPFN